MANKIEKEEKIRMKVRIDETRKDRNRRLYKGFGIGMIVIGIPLSFFIIGIPLVIIGVAVLIYGKKKWK